jgi:hypothetical protein
MGVMTDTHFPDDGRAPVRALSIRLGVAWCAVVLPRVVAAIAFLASRPRGTITTFFFLKEDAGPLLAASLILLLIGLPSVRLSPAGAGWIAGLAERRGRALCVAAALAVGAAALAGWWLVCQAYPLSMDEFFAAFDARIFSRGRLVAEIPPAWRGYAVALQPWFVVHTPGQQYWASPYLPVNAAFRALFGALGSQALAGPFWAASSIVTVYSLGRRLWPERKDVAIVSALLLATSPQLVITAMSPYAMSAHLALNLIWLWLFLRKGWPWHGLAIVVAFMATGLHQALFHPLFAAPFVLQLWLSRRWRLAGFYTAAYAVICLFWVSCWGPLAHGQGMAAPAAAATGAVDFARRALGLFVLPAPDAVGLMALNLLRLVAWQNPLAVALGALGAAHAVRGRDPVLAPLAAGMALTVAAMTMVMPFQGHGWGYRYLHGYLGALSLLAGLAWVKATPRYAEGGGAWSAFCVAAAFSLIVALPLRAGQAFPFIRPYARSYAAIRHARSDVVVVDPQDLVYGVDLVRNDPFLERGPKVMDLGHLTTAAALALCARYKVALFDRADGQALGVASYAPALPTPGKAEVLRSLSCAAHVVAP